MVCVKLGCVSLRCKAEDWEEITHLSFLGGHMGFVLAPNVLMINLG